MSLPAFPPAQAVPEHLQPPPPQQQRPAAGRKPRRRNRVAQSKARPSCPPAHVLVDDLNIGFDPASLRRCAGCGGMVYLWPCLACGQRKAA